MPAKAYSYFQEVVDFILPTFQKLGIEIVQMGIENEPQIIGAYNMLGKTTINQSAYLVSNCLFHMGVDSSLVHLANVYKKDIIALFGISPPEVCGPYFKNAKHFCIEPEFKDGYTYSYNPQEFPRSIDTIKPETVIQKINELLGTDIKLPESLYFGKRFKNLILEITPDSVIDKDFLVGNQVNIRLDLMQERNLEYNIEFVYRNVLQRVCTVITRKPFDLEVLGRDEFKNNLVVFYIINENDDMDFVLKLQSKGIRFALIVKDTDEKLNELKLKYCDLAHVQFLDTSLKYDGEISDSVFYKTNRIIISNNKFYISQAALYENKPVENLENLSQPITIIENKTLFNKDLEYAYIYKI